MNSNHSRPNYSVSCVHIFAFPCSIFFILDVYFFFQLAKSKKKNNNNKRPNKENRTWKNECMHTRDRIIRSTITEAF